MKSEFLLNVVDMKVSLRNEIKTRLQCFVVSRHGHDLKCIQCSKCECDRTFVF